MLFRSRNVNPMIRLQESRDSLAIAVQAPSLQISSASSGPILLSCCDHDGNDEPRRTRPPAQSQHKTQRRSATPVRRGLRQPGCSLTLTQTTDSMAFSTVMRAEPFACTAGALIAHLRRGELRMLARSPAPMNSHLAIQGKISTSRAEQLAGLY